MKDVIDMHCKKKNVDFLVLKLPLTKVDAYSLVKARHLCIFLPSLYETEK